MSHKILVTLIISVAILGLLYYSYDAMNESKEDKLKIRNHVEKQKEENKKVNVIVIIPNKTFEKPEEFLRNRIPMNRPQHSNLFSEFIKHPQERTEKDSKNELEQLRHKQEQDNILENPGTDNSHIKRFPEFLFGVKENFPPFPLPVDHELGN